MQFQIYGLLKKTLNTLLRLPVKVLILLLFTGFIGCSPSRHIQDGEFLLKKNKIAIVPEKYSINKTDLENYYKQKPNTKILGLFPFHLVMYNNLNKGKERKWKTKLMTVIGERPVIYDKFLADKTEVQFKRHLNNKGFYDAKIYREPKFNKKGVSITYFVNTGDPYLIRNVNFDIKDSILSQKILSDTIITLLRRNKPLDIEILESERKRITTILNNDGYYNFTKEFITYQIDSSLNAKQADIFVKVNNFSRRTKEGVIYEPHNQFFINKVYVYMDLGHSGIINDSIETNFIPDTLHYNNYAFIFKDKLAINPEVILSKITLKPGNKYVSDDIKKTYRYLSGLQQFKFINIQFSENIIDSLNFDSLYNIDCHIKLNRMTAQSYQIEFEGTNSSTHWGLGGNILYRHKNIFGGGQILDMKLSGAFEIQHDAISITGDNNSYRNTIEYGLETKIIFPEFLAPFNLGKVIEKYHPSSAVFINYNYQNRPDYTRTIVNAGFGYQWKVENNKKHIFNPIELNIINLRDTSAAFSQYFDTLFLRHSYESQFISASSYTYEFSNQNNNRTKDFIFFKTKSEIAGNIISGVSSLANDNDFEIFNKGYAQYIKSDFDLRFYHYINKSSLIAYRGFVGAGMPYGKSDVMPYVKKYFGGGANGIRAWQVRSLGPGSFVDDSNFPDLAADIKIEANIEYRFDIFWNLKGAFFIDAGNIWAINKFDDRQGASFSLDKFYKEIAVGTGLGARFDFDFILFRIDFGIKVIDPELPEGNRLIWGSKKLSSDDYTWNVGIGYPF